MEYDRIKIEQLETLLLSHLKSVARHLRHSAAPSMASKGSSGQKIVNNRQLMESKAVLFTKIYSLLDLVVKAEYASNQPLKCGSNSGCRNDETLAFYERYSKQSTEQPCLAFVHIKRVIYRAVKAAINYIVIGILGGVACEWQPSLKREICAQFLKFQRAILGNPDHSFASQFGHLLLMELTRCIDKFEKAVSNSLISISNEILEHTSHRIVEADSRLLSTISEMDKMTNSEHLQAEIRQRVMELTALKFSELKLKLVTDIRNVLGIYDAQISLTVKVNL